MINLTLSYECASFIDDFKANIDWFLDLILGLSLYHEPLMATTDRKSILNKIKGLNIDMETLGVLQFEVFVNIYTHLCARHPPLRFKMQQGVYVLYQYLLMDAEEEFVIEMLRYVLPEVAIHDRSSSSAFTDEEGRLWWNQTIQFCPHLSNCEHRLCTVNDCLLNRVPHIPCTIHNCATLRENKLNSDLQRAGLDHQPVRAHTCKPPPPKPCRHRQYSSHATEYVIRVPWRFAPELVRQRCHWTENGIVCLSWHDAPLLMKCLWDSKVRKWQEYDNQEVLYPLLEQTPLHLYAPGPIRKRLKFFRVYGHGPIREEMLWRLYCPSDHAIHAQYAKALAAWKKHEVKYTFSASSASSEVVVYTPLNTEFTANYLKLMPPCIANIIRRHTVNHTHPKYEERYFLFRFLHTIGVPLEAANDMWKGLMNKATDVSGKRQELSFVPSSVYAACDRREETFAFNGCASVAEKHNACPFTDIEDIRERKGHCASVALWQERLKQPLPCPWPERGKGWSPVISYNNLVKNLLKEQNKSLS